MIISPQFFDELAALTLADLSFKEDGTFVISARDGNYKRQALSTHSIEDLASLHPLLPASLKLSSEAYLANISTRRSNLYSDEAKAAFSYLKYGGFEVTNLAGKSFKGVTIASIAQRERLMGEAQSFRIFVEQARVKTQKVGSVRVPYVVHTNNVHLDVSAAELDTRFPGWTTRYLEMKALGSMDDLMSYIFNPLVSKLHQMGQVVKPETSSKGHAPTSAALPADMQSA